MPLEDYWRQKSDRELEAAARQIAEYTEAAQLVIRAEIKRRALPEPPVLTRSISEREPNLMGNLLQRSRLDGPATDGWARWIIGIPLALIFGVLLLLSASHSPRNLVIGVVIIGGVVWSIIKAIEERNCYLTFYEKGLVYECPKHQQAAYYDELQIQQTATKIHAAFVPIRTVHQYVIQFPSGDRVTTSQETIVRKLQQMIQPHVSVQTKINDK